MKKFFLALFCFLLFFSLQISAQENNRVQPKYKIFYIPKNQKPKVNNAFIIDSLTHRADSAIAVNVKLLNEAVNGLADVIFTTDGSDAVLLAAERRPDVIAAERRVAAAFSRVGEAKAARLPRISLSASGSYLSSDILVLQNASNPTFGLGASLLAPLYQGGVLQAQVEIRSAEQKEAVANYARVAQRSFSEVENALAAENALRDRAAILSANIADNERALELAQVQFRVGKTDLRTVEQRQLALYTARSSRLRVQSEQLAQRVNVYLALGGGFGDPASVPVAAR